MSKIYGSELTNKSRDQVRCFKNLFEEQHLLTELKEKILYSKTYGSDLEKVVDQFGYFKIYLRNNIY